jgi:hypothetical protein
MMAKLGALAGLLQNQIGTRRAWAGAGGLLCVLLAATQLPGLFAHTAPRPPLPPASRLFTEDDAKRVAAIAVSKQLPLPAFQIREPADDVPKDFRRFVGIWASDTGWMISNRQFMLIVTHVDRDGTAVGYGVDGPPGQKGHVQGPARSYVFKAHIFGDSLSWEGDRGRPVASFTPEHRVEFQVIYRDGKVGAVSLDPVWTLVEAERRVGPNTTAQ